MRLSTRRGLAALTIGACVVALDAGGSGALSSADPPQSPVGSLGAQSFGRVLTQPAMASVPGDTQDITLITGDRVTFGTLTGKPSVLSVKSAARPGNERVFMQRFTDNAGEYVLPSDAAALVASGVLDLNLFNVRLLAAQGYGDPQATSLPLVIDFPATTSTAEVNHATDALPGSARTRTLESIHAAAVAVDKRQATSFWQAIRGSKKAGTDKAGPDKAGTNADGASAEMARPAGVERIWLDRQLQASLDESTVQIGAPTAWEAGFDGTGVTVAVLDTGIDQTHPDLAGRVVEAVDFTGSGSTDDKFGHGTHVASIVAGTGKANPAFRGVAPGATLLIAKVLGDNGNGTTSGLIDGMEWAAAKGAKVVNISIGSGPTDGTDPPAQAINELSRSTGTLFVVAAGNQGDGASTVNSPGTADAALTVAAVAKRDGAFSLRDQVARFSSRGPRLNNFGLKPEISAPGVAIVAARAAHGLFPPFGDEAHTRLSGTSMASPHVAGAAAALAQRFPGWSGEQLKDALIGTAVNTPETVWNEGAGRVDLGRAATQGVFTTTGPLSLGSLAAAPVTRTVEYANTTDQPVTLTLTSEMSVGGAAVPQTLRPVTPTVVVPAQGTTQVAVSIDPGSRRGLYSGSLSARSADGAIQLITPVGFLAEPARHTLRMRVENLPTDAIAQSAPFWFIQRVDAGAAPLFAAGADISGSVPEGTYSVAMPFSWLDQRGDEHVAYLIDPQVDLSKDETVVLDFRQARLVRISTPNESIQYSNMLGYTSESADGRNGLSVTTDSDKSTGPIDQRISPTERPSIGHFSWFHQHTMGRQTVTAQVAGPDGFSLDARYAATDMVSPVFSGQRTLPVVSVGNGDESEYPSEGVRDRLVLIKFRSNCPQCLIEQLSTAAKAGAAGVLIYGDTGRPTLTDPIVITTNGPINYPLPTLSLPAEKGAALLARVTSRDTSVLINGTPDSPYLYELKFYGDAVDRTDYTVSPAQLATVDERHNSDSDSISQTFWSAYQPEEDDVPSSISARTRRATRTIYFGPVSKDVLWAGSSVRDDVVDGKEFDAGFALITKVFDRADRSTIIWRQGPFVPGVPENPANLGHWTNGFTAGLCVACREGNRFSPALVLMENSGNIRTGLSLEWYYNIPRPGQSGSNEVHLFRDGRELPQQVLPGPFLNFPAYDLPADRGTYVLTDRVLNSYEGTQFSRSADTSWTFTSEPPTGNDQPSGYFCWEASWTFDDRPCNAQPLVFLDYDLKLDLDNRVPAPGVHNFTVKAYHQPSQRPMPRIAGLRLWTTVDGGAHWVPAKVKPLDDGQFRVTASFPKGATSVGLKAEGWDVDGNKIEQQIPDAFGVTSR